MIISRYWTLLVGAMILLLAIGFFHAWSQTAIAGTEQTSGAVAASSLTNAIRTEAAAGVLYIPRYDVYNQPNGVADNTACQSPGYGDLPCVIVQASTTPYSDGAYIHIPWTPSQVPHEIDAWQLDNQYHTHMYAFYYNSAVHTVTQFAYPNRSASDMVQGTPTVVHIWPNITTFRTGMLLASQWADAPIIRTALTAHGVPLCPADNSFHIYQPGGPPPACHPFDAIENMAGSPTSILGGNLEAVIEIGYNPTTAPNAAAKNNICTTNTDCQRRIIPFATVPFAQHVTIVYTPPPPGPINAFPATLPMGINATANIAVAEQWYNYPWTITPSCNGTGVTINNNNTALAIPQAPTTNTAESNLGQGIHVSPATPWAGGFFNGSTVGYAQSTLNITTTNASAPQTCTIQIATQNASPSYTLTTPITISITPAPSPTPSAAPLAMKTWPAYLEVGANGSSLGQSGSSIIAMAHVQNQGLLASLTARMGPWINTALGGGIAAAGQCVGGVPVSPTGVCFTPPTCVVGSCPTPSPSPSPPPPSIIPGPCYAKALNGPGGTPDLTLANMPATIQNALDSALGIGGLAVDSSGCIDELNTTANAWEPIPKFGGVAYEPSDTAKTYAINNSSCGSTFLTTGPWQPASRTGVAALLDVVGGSTGGSCTIDLTDGTTSNPQPDAGQVNVGVVGGTVNDCQSIGGSCTLPLGSGGKIPLCVPGAGGNASSSTSVVYQWSSYPLSWKAIPSSVGTVSGRTFTRTGPGTVYGLQESITFTSSPNAKGTCSLSNTDSWAIYETST